MLELNKLYLMDCMEGMAQFPDKYFDLAIVDPPYGVNYGNTGNLGFGGVAKQNSYKPTKWDKTPPSEKYFVELFRVSKNQIIWGINHYTNIIKVKSGRIIWDKVIPYSQASGLEIAYNSNSSGIKKYTYKWHGMLQENMRNKELRIHPSQKPKDLYKRILSDYAKPDFKIIDTHVGSGSSIIAFLDFGCDWIGFEIDEDYHKAASERIETHKQQLKLF